MRAAVARKGQLFCEEIAELEPQAGQVLVKSLCCGICGSDLHALHQFAGREAGIVLGHEFSAEVLDHGPGSSKPFKTGTRVVSFPVLPIATGLASIGFSDVFPGGYAERMILAESMMIEVPNGLSSRQAAMTEPFAVGAHAVGRAALDEPSAALVVGCGPVGLAVIAALKARGYGPVAAADFSPARRAMAERMGADIVVDPAQESPHTKWAEMGVVGTAGIEQMMALPGAPIGKRAIIFECVGVPGILQGLLEGAPSGAQIIVAGVCLSPDTITPLLAITKQIDFRFGFYYTRDEFAGTLRQIAEGQIDVEAVITQAVGLDGVAAAFEALADPESQVKIVVEP
jgi:threonine dehydrogenase-like Zn-dependent dehydrogenase